MCDSGLEHLEEQSCWLLARVVGAKQSLLMLCNRLALLRVCWGQGLRKHVHRRVGRAEGAGAEMAASDGEGALADRSWGKPLDAREFEEGTTREQSPQEGSYTLEGPGGGISDKPRERTMGGRPSLEHPQTQRVRALW